MEFTIKTSPPEKVKTACVVVGVFADGKLAASARALDKLTDGALSAAVSGGDLEDKPGSTLLLPQSGKHNCQRILLVRLGEAKEHSEKHYREALAGAARALAKGAAHDAAVCLADDVEVAGRDLAWQLREAARVLADGSYHFPAPRAKKDAHKKGVRKLLLLLRDKVSTELEAAVLQGQAAAEGMALARDLANQAPNVCNPAYLAQTALDLAKQFKLKTEILEREDMEKLGMGALLSVARGSHQPPKLIVLHYQGGKSKDQPVVLVGKGITFDTGGISLKPAAEMDEMKYDMCGAASVLGTLKALARMALPINVIGLIPAAENMPGGNASRPGDVVTSMSGQTIEILNTDAEGRLILCDALSYAERFKPACVIDIATLTGACVIALGKIPSGLMANNEELADALMSAGRNSGDRVWPLPLWEEYQELLKSNFADMGNVGGRYAGAITAGCFLSRFTKEYAWAHLDIAGTAWVSGEHKGATGRPVPLLAQFLIDRAAPG